MSCCTCKCFLRTYCAWCWDPGRSASDAACGAHLMTPVAASAGSPGASVRFSHRGPSTVRPRAKGGSGRPGRQSRLPGPSGEAVPVSDSREVSLRVRGQLTRPELMCKINRPGALTSVARPGQRAARRCEESFGDPQGQTRAARRADHGPGPRPGGVLAAPGGGSPRSGRAAWEAGKLSAALGCPSTSVSAPRLASGPRCSCPSGSGSSEAPRGGRAGHW